MNKIQKALYGKHWLLAHMMLLFIFNVIIYKTFERLGVVNNIVKLINSEMISLSGTVAGFEFAGVSIFISLEGNKKMKILKDIKSEWIIYKIIIYSIVFLVISIICMVIKLHIFDLPKIVNNAYCIFNNIIASLSIITLELGYLLFISSIIFLAWILKQE